MLNYKVRLYWIKLARIRKKYFIKGVFFFALLLLCVVFCDYFHYKTGVSLPGFIRCFLFRSRDSQQIVKAQHPAAIVYLTSLSRLFQLTKSLQHLFENFNDQFHYPVAIFHYGAMNERFTFCICEAALNRERASVIHMVAAENIREFPPSFRGEDYSGGREIVFRNYFPDYQFMCAFFFLGIYRQSWIIENNISYYMRLDSDSYILSKINYDIFEYMRKHNLAYAYRVRSGESSCCSRYLTKLIRMYIRDEGMQITSKDVEWIGKYNWEELEMLDTTKESAAPMEQYYANLEVVNVQSFRDDPEVFKWEMAVWNDTRYHVNGIFTQRWGDSLLRFYTVHLFPQLWKRIHYLCDIEYYHQFDFPRTCNFTDKIITV